jgi:bifunctional N-acetylglucosamine-1-phosphate-uridyltransferase/glucosamine-1-phosphate-acetyltransferase GlmU-like protein
MKKAKRNSSASAPSKAFSKAPPSVSAARMAVAIMAAGKGTRLKSQLAKVLHEVGGKPLLEHVIRAAVQVVPAKDVYAIIGHDADRVRAAMQHTGVNFVLQGEQRGTGHALMVAREALSGYDDVIVLSGDAPLITAETIARLKNFHLEQKAAMTLLSAELKTPTGYGRVLRRGPRMCKRSLKKKLPAPRRKKSKKSTPVFMSSTRQSSMPTLESFRPTMPTLSTT